MSVARDREEATHSLQLLQKQAEPRDSIAHVLDDVVEDVMPDKITALTNFTLSKAL